MRTVLIILALALPAFADRFEAPIRELANEDGEARGRARRTLLRLGTPALAKLREAENTATDGAIRARCVI